MDPEEYHQSVMQHFYRAMLEDARQIGLTSIKSLLTLNSGAFVVLLTFIGNSAAQSQFFVPIENIKLGMYCFLGGIVLCFAALAASYLGTLEVATPYPRKDTWLDRNRRWFTLFVVSIAFSSLAVFVVGVVAVIRGVQVL